MAKPSTSYRVANVPAGTTEIRFKVILSYCQEVSKDVLRASIHAGKEEIKKEVEWNYANY